jgi:ergothioneine biosynthesis protein EgtB
MEYIMERGELIDRFSGVRQKSEYLCLPLEIEDYVVQPIDDVSPPKWHLGHTSWFFERLLLQDHDPEFKLFHKQYHYIFNSYYHSLGERVLRNLRGTLSRPTVRDVMEFRKSVTERMINLIENAPEEKYPQIEKLTVLGINHEQQHQELLLMDIKYIYYSNPLRPAYIKPGKHTKSQPADTGRFILFNGGMCRIGAGGVDFAYDNEYPRHDVYLKDFKLAQNLSTCGDYLEFINDGGYENDDLWLSDGWDTIRGNNWKHPLYWEKTNDGWHIMTLSGMRRLDPAEPVSHISYYEAKAFARWAGKRLHTEQEWETAAIKAANSLEEGSFMEDETYHPACSNALPGSENKLNNMLGGLWEWTDSSYLPYPGYKQETGPLGEYNGKFMSNQMVLRGGCCATSRDHIRPTYRNFFQCDKRWQFSGIRLAEDA